MQKLIEDAIKRSKNWAHTGWEMSFGFNNVKVCSIDNTSKLPDTFAYKLESVSYWQQVDNAGQDAALWGERALKAYKDNNATETADALYQAYYLEKFYEKYTNTWKAVLKQYEESINK